MTVFEEIKEAVPIVAAARRYGLEVDRHGKTRCIFHSPDKHPSLSFKDAYFKCFSCGEAGDVFKLVQALTGAQRPIDAAHSLNQDFALGLDVGGSFDPVLASQRQQERERVAAFEAWIENAATLWAKWCRTLQGWMQLPMDDPRYMEACHRLDYADYIFTTVFIEGDFNTKAQFYKSHRQEVTALEQRFRESRHAG